MALGVQEGLWAMDVGSYRAQGELRSSGILWEIRLQAGDDEKVRGLQTTAPKD